MILTPVTPEQWLHAIISCRIAQKKEDISQREAIDFCSIWAPFCVTFKHNRITVFEDLSMLENAKFIFSKKYRNKSYLDKAGADIRKAFKEGVTNFGSTSLEFTCQIQAVKNHERYEGPREPESEPDRWIVKVGQLKSSK